MPNLNNIRQFITDKNLDACIIHMRNRSDNKISDRSDIDYLCGFTGSAGICIVTQDRAILCVDGRYEKQGAEQVSKNEWEVVCDNYVSILRKIREQKPSLRVAVCGDAVSYQVCKNLGDVVITHYNFFDHIYRQNHCKLVKSYFCNEHKQRIERFRDFIQNDCALICDPTLIAWLFCIRMDELQDFTPVPRATAYVTKNEALLFCDLEAGDDFDFEVLQPACIHNKLSRSKTVIADSSQTPCGIWREGFVDKRFPHFEAVKSTAEISGMKLACRHASEAFNRALAKIGTCRTEQDIADLLYDEMSVCHDFLGFSFDPIVASGPNSSIIHYTERKSVIQDGLLLIDVGGQYKYGTTDMTRTVWVGGGEPPDDVMLLYRAVKDAVDMFSRAKFPVGTAISSLDALARYHIWQVGHDYKFGTGHGVGCFAKVHEYPAVSQRTRDATLEPGNIVTVEPGIYTDEYGIRLENMLLVIDLGDGFLGFEVLSEVGYDSWFT